MAKCVIIVRHKWKVSNLIQQFPTSRCFCFLIKICFFNSLYLAFLTWLFSTSFFSMLLSIGWFAIPSLFTIVLYSLKKGDSLYFSENDNHDAHSIWSIIPNICLQGIKLLHQSSQVHCGIVILSPRAIV